MEFNALDVRGKNISLRHSCFGRVERNNLCRSEFASIPVNLQNNVEQPCAARFISGNDESSQRIVVASLLNHAFFADCPAGYNFIDARHGLCGTCAHYPSDLANSGILANFFFYAVEKRPQKIRGMGIAANLRHAIRSNKHSVMNKPKLFGNSSAGWNLLMSDILNCLAVRRYRNSLGNNDDGNACSRKRLDTEQKCEERGSPAMMF